MAVLQRVAPAFPVRDVRASLAHYERLGFATRLYVSGEYGYATRDGIEIHLGLAPTRVNPSPKHSAYVWVDDADELAEEWRAAGAEVHGPEDTEWGQHEGALVDPDGEVVPMPSDDAWMRDVGPTFVVDDGADRRGIDWVFNAWGGLYDPWAQDDAVAARVLDHHGDMGYRAPLVLEGGSIDVDGEGTVLTTEQCLLNPNRNSSLSRAEIERGLRDHLGIERVIWLGEGVVDDETSGHVDNLACFVRPGVVVLTWTDDPSDPQHAVSLDARRRLDAAGFDVRLLPSPGPLFMTAEEAAGIEVAPGTKPRAASDRLAGSYVNFYVANGAVVVPLLDERRDDEALETIGALFPDRSVVGVPAREILLGGGNIHCITQQVPSRTLEP